MLAMGYIAVRVLYTAFYLMNLGVLRSATWGAGVAIVVALFCIVP